MELLLTEAARRIIARARHLASESSAADVEPLHLLWALVADESHGADLLREYGITDDVLKQELDLPVVHELTSSPDEGESLAMNDTARDILSAAHRQRGDEGRTVELGSEHLLFGLLEVPSKVSAWLDHKGILLDTLSEKVKRSEGHPSTPLDVDIALNAVSRAVSEETETLRILDASANRAREGVRVVEDYVRFVLDDAHLTRLLKTWRHEFTESLSLLGNETWISRDTQADVGTTVTTPSEFHRPALLSVVQANGKRLEESLRSLEEYGKVINAQFAGVVEQLRYRFYTLEKAILNTQFNRTRLTDCRLYLLATADLCDHGLGPAVRQSIPAGVSIVQMREKNLNERQLLEQARLLRSWTRELGALLIINDRPDIVVLSDADGVHVGQDDMTVKDARKIIGPNKLIGVSTHTIEQARQAVIDGADYLGVGPVFRSTTKEFSQFAGLEFVKQVAAEITLPWFAIGGINEKNISQVIEAGATRVAVSGAICGAKEPGVAARGLGTTLRSPVG
ncbi:MAG: thiamine phosphate synthase [Planctomycetota bacterium]|nr:thiamine phosphate synthase [Planctomycetota bacterium]MDA1213146.1 thiamine phosphate synthase [Planctomycetota bacterium]